MAMQCDYSQHHHRLYEGTHAFAGLPALSYNTVHADMLMTNKLQLLTVTNYV